MRHKLVLGGVIVGLLAGCGLVPPIPIDDPLRLNGESVTLSLASGAVSSQAAMSGSVNATLEDILSGVNIPSTPGSFKACYDFTVTGDVPSGAPTSLKLTNIELNLTLQDATNGSTTIQATADEVTLSVSGGKYTGSGKNLCGNFADVAKVIAILKNPPAPNTLTGTFSLETDAALPSGTTLTITFENGKGEIKL